MKNDPHYIDGSIEITNVEGLCIYNKKSFTDERGYFREALKLSTLENSSGIKFNIKTWNHAISNPGVLRGIHSESCAKLIYPTHGNAFIVFVDIRPDSKTFGKYAAFTTHDKDERTFFKPEGLGIGVLAQGPEPFEFLYLMDKEYDQLKQQGLAWDDADVNIAWPNKTPILSERE